MRKPIAGAILAILLLLSLISGIILIVVQRAERRPSVGVATVRRDPRNAVGIVEIYGPIMSPQDSGSSLFYHPTSKVAQTLRQYKENDNIKGVIVRLNSPGGTVGAIQEITREIEELKEAGKPVVASVSDLAASGGYYIASACDKIVVNSGSIIGNIGVIFTSADMSALFENIGVDFQVIKSGPYKDAGAFHRELSVEERAFLQDLVDDAHDQFISSVSQGRDMPISRVRELSKGQIFTGRKAKELNLVDDIGGVRRAQEITEELAGIEDSEIIKQPADTWRRVLGIFGRSFNMLERILSKGETDGLKYLYQP